MGQIRRRRSGPAFAIVATAVLAAVGCSPSPAEPKADTTSAVTVTSTLTSTAQPPGPTPTATVPAPGTPTPVAATGPFTSPSGNIRCNMYTSTGGLSTALCSVADHDWKATQPANCGANWGDRVDLEAGSPATFGCYGQELPPATHTLEYGQLQVLGSISCTSDNIGIMCLDNDSGHFFRVSREDVQLG